MTNGTNHTLLMPDVIHADLNKGWHYDNISLTRTRYIRADLVPAAPTGDKAAALDAVENERLFVENYDERIDHTTYALLPPIIQKTIKRALQEHTAPDYYLVKALEYSRDVIELA